MYLAAGTQADLPQNNEIQVMKLSQLHKTRKSQRQDDEDSDSDSGDDENVDDDPLLEHRSLPTNGGTNRIRVYQSPNSIIAASWNELGKVHLWNLQSSYNSLTQLGFVGDGKTEKPIYT